MAAARSASDGCGFRGGCGDCDGVEPPVGWRPSSPAGPGPAGGGRCPGMNCGGKASARGPEPCWAGAYWAGAGPDVRGGAGATPLRNAVSSAAIRSSRFPMAESSPASAPSGSASRCGVDMP